MIAINIIAIYAGYEPVQSVLNVNKKSPEGLASTCLAAMCWLNKE